MLFNRYERWIEELHGVFAEKHPKIASTREMDIVAISTEISTTCNDRHNLNNFGVPVWESMASDLEQTIKVLGPETSQIVSAPSEALIELIRTTLIVQKKTRRGKTRKEIAAGMLPSIEAQVHRLTSTLELDEVMISAWRDVISACKEEDHRAKNHNQILFLANNVLALQGLRGHASSGHKSPVRGAVDILMDNALRISEVQHHLGIPSPKFDRHMLNKPSSLELDERKVLAERWLIERPKRGNYIVWFRLKNAYMLAPHDLSHGDVTFYTGPSLNCLVRGLDGLQYPFEAFPEELVSEAVRDEYKHDSSDDELHSETEGFELDHGMVYARVLVHQVESHKAASEARLILEILLDTLAPPEGMWELLNGNLLFENSSGYHSLQFGPLQWGLKYDREDPIFPENDNVAKNLKVLDEIGWAVTSPVAQQLKPIVALSSALNAAHEKGAEDIVSVAVRVIEHCNSWVTHGNFHWKKFVTHYFLDEFARNAFIERSQNVTSLTISSSSPNLPGSGVHPVQEEIRRKVYSYSSGTIFNRYMALEETSRLREIYIGHPFHRRLAELDDILSSGDSLRESFQNEQTQVSLRIARLNRLRNAATHGGTVSQAAFNSVETFALALAQLVLNTARRAVFAGESMDDFFEKARLASRNRVNLLFETGDLRHLFVEPSDKY